MDCHSIAVNPIGQRDTRYNATAMVGQTSADGPPTPFGTKSTSGVQRHMRTPFNDFATKRTHSMTTQSTPNIAERSPHHAPQHVLHALHSAYYSKKSTPRTDHPPSTPTSARTVAPLWPRYNMYRTMLDRTRAALAWRSTTVPL